MEADAGNRASSRPTFTVIIPTYNRQELLDVAVDSVHRQEFTDWELIVVDDHSPDAVTVQKDPRIILLRNETNLGKPASVNRALTLARGAYICILDDDDAWAPERLKNAHLAHLQGADFAVCQTRVLTSSPNQDRGQQRPMIRILPGSELRKKETLGSMGRLSVRSDLFAPMNESYRASQDVEWYLRVLPKMPIVAEISTADWFWRRHSGARHLNGVRARITSSERLLTEYAEYYSRHKEQRSRRVRNLGYQHLKVRAWQSALQCGISSWRSSPSPQAAKLILRSLAAAVPGAWFSPSEQDR